MHINVLHINVKDEQHTAQCKSKFWGRLLAILPYWNRCPSFANMEYSKMCVDCGFGHEGYESLTLCCSLYFERGTMGK